MTLTTSLSESRGALEQVEDDGRQRVHCSTEPDFRTALDSSLKGFVPEMTRG